MRNAHTEDETTLPGRLAEFLGLANPALRPPRFGLRNPSSFLQHMTDEAPEERTAILRGKVWRQTKEGYVEVTYPPPAPYWADHRD